MARTDARNVNPSLSSDPRDKLLAALNWSYGKLKRGVEYDRAPMYFDGVGSGSSDYRPTTRKPC